MTSSFDENNVRTIAINSPDIVQGKIVGNFQIDQLQKMVENSLGSLYANYNPNRIKKGQYLKFDFHRVWQNDQIDDLNLILEKNISEIIALIESNKMNVSKRNFDFCAMDLN